MLHDAANSKMTADEIIRRIPTGKYFARNKIFRPVFEFMPVTWYV